MVRSSTGRVLLVVCLLFLATSTVAATPIAPASPDRATHLTHPVESLGDPLDDATNTTNESTDTTTTNDTTDTTDTTTETVNDTSDTNTDTTNNTTDDTTDDTTTETVDNTTNTTTETTENTTDTTTDTTDTTTDTTTGITENTNSTTETVDQTVDETTETTNSAGSSLSNETSVSLESSAAFDTAAGGASLQASLTSDGALDATSDTVESASDSLDGTTNSVDDSVSTVVDSTDDTIHVASDSGGDEILHAAGPGAGSGESASDESGDSTSGEVDSETEVNVEEPGTGGGSGEDQIAGLLASAYRRLGGLIPESVPGGPMGGVVGLGGLTLAAVVSRQWLTQTAGTGTTSFLTAGFGGRVDGWLEKLKRFVVPLRYSRYDNSDPLEHDARRALYEVIESSPGVYLTDLAEQAGVPVSTARHHVRVLSDERLVRTEKRHGKRRYYPVTETNTELTDALSEPAKAAVLHALVELGEAPVGQLADELDRDPSTVTHHLQALESDGLVVRERRGRAVVNRLCEDVKPILTGADASSSPVGKANAPADD